MRKPLFPLLALVVLIPSLLAAAPARAVTARDVSISPQATASIEIVRQNLLDDYSAAGASRDSQRMRDALGTLEANVRTVTASGYLRPDGSWTDINYDETPDGSWSPWEHFRRMTSMARAYRTPGQAYYNDPLLLTQLTNALTYTNKFFGAPRLPLGNWWFWTFGGPLDLAPTLVLMRGAIPQTLYDQTVATLTLRIGTSPYSRVTGPVPVGENLAWSCFTHLCLGLLKDDPTMLAAVRDAMSTLCLPTTGDGVKIDSSFQQHGAQLYTGGYGGSYANDVAQYALLTRNSDYALPPAAMAAFADYMVDGVAWSLYGNYFDVSVIGREVARVSTTGFNGIAALVQAAAFDSPRAAEIRTAARAMLSSWQWSLPPDLAALAVQAEQLRVPASWPSGHRHYYASDYTIHRRPGWFASVKMFSSRTKSGENTNGENILGSRQSDGRFYLTLNGTEYFGRDIWPTADWTRLSGITVEQKSDTANDTFGTGTRAFAGGTGDGQNGVSAMDLDAINSTVTAKKSWFFFDDAILFLNADIASSSPNRIETIVNQWPMSSIDAAFVADGSTRVLRNGVTESLQPIRWAVSDQVGYWFPSGATVNAKREMRSGSWSMLGGSSDTTTHSNPFLTLWLDHGTTPFGATAEYAIVPNVTTDAMRKWATDMPIAILANNTNVAAARDRRTNATGMVFWRASSVEGVQTDLASILYLVDNRSGVSLSATDPTNGSGVYHVTLPGRMTLVSSDAAVKVTRDVNADSTTIELPRNGGKSVQVKLQRDLADAHRRTTR